MTLVFSFPSLSAVVGKVERAKGRVSILKKGSFRGIDYRKVNGNVEVGDVVRTKRKSFADILFIDRTRVFLKESSRLIVEKYVPGKEVALNSPSGKVIYRVVKVTKGIYEIKTPTALIGVKGTELATIVDDGISTIVVKEGRVKVVNPEFPRYSVVVNKNMATVVKPGKLPSKPVFVSRRVIERIFSLKGKTLNQPEKKPSVKAVPVERTFPVVESYLEKFQEVLQEENKRANIKLSSQETTEEENSETIAETTPSQETTEEENEEIITETTSELIIKNGKVNVNVSIPITETPK